MDEAIPISKMAKKLRIKISTARLIIRKYKESGKFYAKNFRIKTSKVKTRPIPLQSENNSIDNSRKATT
jgi:transposase